MDKVYENQHISQTVVVTHLLNEVSVATLQKPFYLTEVHFQSLKGRPPFTATLATIIFSAVVGYAFKLGPEIAAMFEGGANQLTDGDIRTISFGIVLSAVIYGVGYFAPNERKRTMKEISTHFKKEKATTRFVTEGSNDYAQ
jgi:hypothetical protein